MTKKQLQERLNKHSSLLIQLHTARWTGNQKRFAELMDQVAAYSYSRTNSNGDEKAEEAAMERTFQELGK